MILRTGALPGAQLYDELVVDNFAGGGGASMGIERALGRSVDVAINHDPEAVALHRANHPGTLHLCQDVFAARPLDVTHGRPVSLAWFSPDCTYFSKARGAKPIRDVRRRDLAWVVVRWAKTVRPRVIALENVEEFRTWGPLTPEGLPCPERRGRTFTRWVAELRGAGYAVEWRELRGCDYGAPTVRKRLFLLARCDGAPITWPAPTHGPGRALPFRVAAECIDWSLPCPSIFERARPLAENTLRRIAAGLRRFVLGTASPFIVSNLSNNAPQDPRAPLSTLLSGNHKYLVEPFTVATNHGDSRGRRTYPLDEPMRTVCSAARSEALVVPLAINTRNGERHGQHGEQAPRVLDLGRPWGTVTAKGSQGALVAAFLATYYGGDRGSRRTGAADAPLRTQTTENRHAVVAAWLAKHYGGVVGQRVDVPASTITARDGHALCTASLAAGADHGREVTALLERYAPGPVEVDGAGRPVLHVAGVAHVLVDVGMRMLQPRELFACQGFPPEYVIDRGVGPRGEALALTKTAQTRLVGNSVCPPVVEALVRANVLERAGELVGGTA